MTPASDKRVRLVILSGLSGSGKSVALHALEDLGYYCIDNIPVALLRSFIDEILPRRDGSFESVAVGIDARNQPDDIGEIPELLMKLRADGLACELLFLQASDDVLLARFRETRRKHPLTTQDVGLAEAVAKERELLGPVIDAADLIIDTSSMTVYELREQIRARVGGRQPRSLSILIQSFGYKRGVPADADFVFDVRCLPNPYWEPKLRPLSGRDEAVIEFLDREPLVQSMVDGIAKFLEEWIPRYQDFQRSYLTIAIGCTGGQHRSVYVTEAVAKRLDPLYGPIRTRHHEIP